MSLSKSDKIALATVADDAFLPGAAVMIQSFLGANPWFEGDIIVFCDESLSSKNRDLLSERIEKIEFRTVRQQLQERLDQIIDARPDYREMRARFFFVEAFSLRGYDRVLICDADLLFQRSLRELFEIEHPFIAAPDGPNINGQGRDRETFQPIEPTGNCLKNTFNCGLLLVSEALLNDETERGLLEMLTPENWRRVSTGSADGILLNRFFEGRQLLVSSRFNLLLRHFEATRAREPFELAEAHAIHFNLPFAPWELPTVMRYEDSPEVLRAFELWHGEFQLFLRLRQQRQTMHERQTIFHGARYDLKALIQTHLFIISPNNSGSTYLKNVFATSSRTWNLKKEGQYTFGFAGPTPVSLDCALLWAADPKMLQTLCESPDFNWEQSRRSWYFQAFGKSPDASVFVEKSPQFILHVDALAEHFRRAKFLFLVRNPYAVVEGILRREGARFETRRIAIETAARHVLTAMRIQKENIEAHPSDGLFFTYEEMCAEPDEIASKIRAFVPELDDLQLGQRLSVKAMYDEPLRDMNADQIARLSDEDRRILHELFEPEAKLLSQFGYES